MGALIYAEYGAAIPRSGSDFVYIKRAWTPYLGFLAGWATLAVNVPASIGAISLAFASQLESLKPAAHSTIAGEAFAIKFTAVGLIAIFTIINYVGVRQGGNTQAFLTGLKLLLIGILVAVGFSTIFQDLDASLPRFGQTRSVVPGSLAIAFVGAIWATDGWAGVTRVAGEVARPQKTIPRALVLSAVIVTAVYVLLNAAYLAALGLDGMAGTGDPTSDRLLASRAADALLGTPGRVFVAILIMVSILGGLNGLTLSGPRVYFAMARDRLFFGAVRRVHETHKTPYVSILMQGAIGAVLALFFTFEQLTGYVVVAAWLSYTLAAVGLIRLRRTEPDLDRPYRVPLYPWIPLFFALVSGSFLVYIVWDAVALAVAGDATTLAYLGLNVGLLGLSVPFYWWFRAKNAARSTPPTGAEGP